MICIQHFNAHPQIEYIFPCANSNQISQEYYNHLVGEINRRTIKAAVCSLYYPQFKVTYFYRVDIM